MENMMENRRNQLESITVFPHSDVFDTSSSQADDIDLLPHINAWDEMASNDAAPHKQKKLTNLTKYIRGMMKNRRNRVCLASDAFDASFSQAYDIDFFPHPGTTAFRKMEREEELLAEDELKVEEAVTYDEEEFLSAEEELKVELSYKGETEIELQVYDDSYPIPEKVKNSNPSQEQDVQQKTGQNFEQDVREPVINPKIETSKETGYKALEMNDLLDAAIYVIEVLTPEKVNSSNPSQESGTTAAVVEHAKIEQVANINKTGSKALEMNDLWDAAKDVAIIALDTDKYWHTLEEQLECLYTLEEQLKNSNPSQENITKTEDTYTTVIHVKHHSPATTGTQRRSWYDVFMWPPEGSHRHPPRMFWAYLLISVI